MQMYINYPSWISPTVLPFLPVRWYAIMYLVAFGLTYFFFRKQCEKGSLNYMNTDDSTVLFTYIIIGLIVGARIFSTLFYQGSWFYWKQPWKIFWPFYNGKFIGLPGMSYHGGVVGAIVGGLLFSKKYKYKFFDVADTVIAGIPLAYTFGRLGNFINAELWGRVSTKSFAMVFPDAEKFSTNLPWVREIADTLGITYTENSLINLPRHPSQLYEAFFEGIVLFLVIWFIIKPIAEKRKTKHGPGLISGSYFIGYGLVRFFIEYLREPDKQIGFIIALGKETEPLALFKSFLNISLGQVLCFLMIIAGIAMIIYAIHSKPIIYQKKKGKKNAHK